MKSAWLAANVQKVCDTDYRVHRSVCSATGTKCAKAGCVVGYIRVYVCVNAELS